MASSHKESENMYSTNGDDGEVTHMDRQGMASNHQLRSGNTYPFRSVPQGPAKLNFSSEIEDDVQGFNVLYEGTSAYSVPTAMYSTPFGAVGHMTGITTTDQTYTPTNPIVHPLFPGVPTTERMADHMVTGTKVMSSFSYPYEMPQPRMSGRAGLSSANPRFNYGFENVMGHGMCLNTDVNRQGDMDRVVHDTHPKHYVDSDVKISLAGNPTANPELERCKALQALAAQLGMSGDEAKNFVVRKMEQESERNYTSAEKERDRARERERELHEHALQRNRDIAERNRLELSASRISENSDDNVQGWSSRRRDKPIPHFNEKSMPIEQYIRLVEQISELNRWPKSEWFGNMMPMLSGRALEAVMKYPPEELRDFDRAKEVIFAEYRLTTECYRKRFRDSKRKHDENFEQFAYRLRKELDDWCTSAKVEPRSCVCESERETMFFELILLEQFYNHLPVDVKKYVVEKKPQDLKEAAGWADNYQQVNEQVGHTAGRRDFGHTGGKSGGKGGSWQRRKEEDKRTGGQENSELVEQRSEDKKLTPPVNKSGRGGKLQLQGGGLKKCFGCGQTGHFKSQCPRLGKLSSMRATQMDDGPTEEKRQPPEPHFLCDNCHHMPFTATSEATVNGKRVLCYRDTGASEMFVRTDLIDQASFTGEHYYVQLGNGQRILSPTAIVDIHTPFVAGRMKVQTMVDLDSDVYVGQCAKMADGKCVEVPVYPCKNLCAMTTRSQAAKENSVTPTVEQSSIGLEGIGPDQFQQLQKEDPTLQKCWKAAENKETLRAGQGKVKYVVKNNCLRRIWSQQRGTFSQVCVPRSLRNQVLKVAHDIPMGGHLGGRKTRERIWQTFYWPGMCQDISRYVASCDVCQRTTPKGRTTRVPMGRMPVIDVPFRRVSVDIVGPIKPVSKQKNRYVLVIVDQATRYPEAIPLKNVETTTVAAAMNEYFCRVGIPEEILSDRGGQFTGAMMQEIHRLLGIKGLTTTPYHPQCNGLVERFNATLKAMLKRLCLERPRDWDVYIPYALFAYREVPQKSTGYSPFELLYGRTVKGLVSVLKDVWIREKEEQQDSTRPIYSYVVDLRKKIESTCKLAAENLKRESEKHKKVFDRRAKRRSFKAGSQVMLLRPVKHNKLEMAWKGPYQVVSRQGDCDYVIRIGQKDKLYHANLLKEYLTREPNDPMKAKQTGKAGASLTPLSVIEESEQPQNGSFGEGDSTPECGMAPLVTTGIPELPLKSKESVQDVHLDPNNSEAHQPIKDLIKEFADVLTDVPNRTDLCECHIELSDPEPVRVRQYPLPLAKRDTIGDEVKDMLRLGVIEPSSSPFSSPIVLISKRDGSIRFCIDYRALNRKVIFDAEPMPDPDYLFAKVSHARFISKLDLCKGYWQVPVAEADRHKTAFTTPQGSFQWVMMPFGLKTAGAVFSRMMRMLLEPLRMREIGNFIDDIIVATDSLERHVECLRALLGRLREAKLSAKPSKCFLGFKTLEYLGHKIGDGCIRPEGSKLEKLAKIPRPTSRKQVRAFLGLAGYYRRFIPNFAQIAAPLSSATKSREREPIQWNSEREEAFQTLKKLLLQEPMCQLPNMAKPFIVRTDASQYAIGALLLQNGPVETNAGGVQQEESLTGMVAAVSRKLSSAELNYSTIEKECLAIVWGVERFSPYLYGNSFVLQTDHNPLQYLQSMKASNPRLMRWALKLQAFDVRIEAIPGADNVGADLLSRL